MPTPTPTTDCLAGVFTGGGGGPGASELLAAEADDSEMMEKEPWADEGAASTTASSMG
jgi:hypothetical protein